MTFAERVYEAVTRIPEGYVATYGQIAEIIGCPGGSRAVGNALHVNPFAPVVPCHRVVAANGQLAAHFGGSPGGPQVQYERLKAEGVAFWPPTGGPWCGQIPRVDLEKCGITIESHPLEPFLPANATILFLGSFPPPRSKWSMEFFYPNWINDFWRIQGLIHYADAQKFTIPQAKCFNKQQIIDFCKAKNLAFYDTAVKVFRQKGNASDEFLQILQPTNVQQLLIQLPQCQTIVTTGGKSSEELQSILKAPKIPPVGQSIPLQIIDRQVTWWRMPSTSRAYPMALQAKAAHYAKLFFAEKH